MKKVIVSTAACIAMLSFCACSENTYPQPETARYTENTFHYGLSNVSAFTVYDGMLYAAHEATSEVQVLDPQGEQIAVYDLGEGYHETLSYYNGDLYAFTYGDTFHGITVYHCDTGTHELYPLDADITSVIAMTIVDDHIYLIYRSQTYDAYQESVQFNEDDGYLYMGEKAVSLDIEDAFEVRSVDIKNVIGLKPYSETEVLYYAYDDIGGYYFTVYDTQTKKFSEKIYNNVPKYTFSFAYHKEEDMILYSDFSNQKLTAVPMQTSSSQVDFMANTIALTGNDLQFHDGQCYILDRKTGDVFRTEYRQAVKDDQEIIFRSSKIYYEVPYGCGYRINSAMLEEDEIALTLLAEDSDYDICMMSSEEHFSRDIRDRGSFYALNDVPMVQQYLDACFPYLQEAATDEDGNIWMIPIAVDVPCIVYNPSVCEKQNIVFDKDLTWQYLFETADRLYASEELRSRFQLNGYQAVSDILHRYHSFHAFSDGKSRYDTQLFRNICGLLKHYEMGAADSLHTWIAGWDQSQTLTDHLGQYIFELRPYKFELYEEEAFRTLRAFPTPSLEGEERNCANCVYFCVNASSDDLSAALDYISTYCAYMLERKDTYLFQDKNTNSFADTPLGEDLYGIYANAQITFSLADEVFMDDYMKYSRDEISLDEFVTEVERKTDIYLNE